MLKSVFIEKVLQLMNEYTPEQITVIAGSDLVQIKYHIETVITDAYRKSIKLLPKSYFIPKSFKSSTLLPVASGGVDEKTISGNGYLQLPADFHLLLSFKMKGWENKCLIAYPEESPIAQRQNNEYVRGDSIYPVCVLGQKIVGSSNFESLSYYSLPKGTTHEIEEALYIPLLDTTGTELIISERLYKPLTYLTASIVFGLFEKQNISAILEKLSTEVS